MMFVFVAVVASRYLLFPFGPGAVGKSDTCAGSSASIPYGYGDTASALAGIHRIELASRARMRAIRVLAPARARSRILRLNGADGTSAPRASGDARQMRSLACSSPPSTHLAPHPDLRRPIDESRLRLSAGRIWLALRPDEDALERVKVWLCVLQLKEQALPITINEADVQVIRHPSSIVG